MVIVSVWQVHSAAIFSSRSQLQFYKDCLEERPPVLLCVAISYPHVGWPFHKAVLSLKIMRTVLIGTKINHLIHWIVHLVSCSEHCLNIVWMFRIRFQFPFQPPDDILYRCSPSRASWECHRRWAKSRTETGIPPAKQWVVRQQRK